MTTDSRRAVHPIEQRSYEILRSRADLSALPPFTRAVTERVVHASADLDYVDDLVCDEAALADAALFVVEPSQMPFDLGPGAPANQPSRRGNAPFAAGNSGSAPGNGSAIHANSPRNPANGPGGGRAREPQLFQVTAEEG